MTSALTIMVMTGEEDGLTQSHTIASHLSDGVPVLDESMLLLRRIESDVMNLSSPACILRVVHEQHTQIITDVIRETTTG